ncbi:MAG: hypothetical protein B7X57_09835 [Erythrobacter sp. 34-65-8]|nr:MAG: hypothetical protein B7X57_09835 [Erythrobacter sp. 34-65-8]
MRFVLIMAVLAVAGCGSEADRRDAAAKVAEIEQANEGVAVPLKPEPILYPDIEQHALTDPACAFAPDGGGMAPVLLAMEDRAVMRLSGDIAEFAPDNGVQKGPGVAWTRYDGLAYSIHFGLGTEQPEEPGGKRYEATLEVRDGADRAVYRASGYAQCPS